VTQLEKDRRPAVNLKLAGSGNLKFIT